MGDAKQREIALAKAGDHAAAMVACIDQAVGPVARPAIGEATSIQRANLLCLALGIVQNRAGTAMHGFTVDELLNATANFTGDVLSGIAQAQGPDAAAKYRRILLGHIQSMPFDLDGEHVRAAFAAGSGPAEAN